MNVPAAPGAVDHAQRSFMNPFPEEIDRRVQMASIADFQAGSMHPEVFAHLRHPTASAMPNWESRKGKLELTVLVCPYDMNIQARLLCDDFARYSPLDIDAENHWSGTLQPFQPDHHTQFILAKCRNSFRRDKRGSIPPSPPFPQSRSPTFGGPHGGSHPN
jgi:hypothetical protein